MRLARSASAADLLPEEGADLAAAGAGEDVSGAPPFCIDDGLPVGVMSLGDDRDDGAAAAAGLFRLPVLIPESIVLLLSSRNIFCSFILVPSARGLAATTQ